MKQLVHLYKTHNSNKKHEYSPGKGIKHPKKYPPKNGT